jgi:hypothetical protein
MNELVYVLAVEALVFGALCTVVLAQRLDVLHWPADRTWPVLASSVQVLLLNAHVLLLLCCFVAAGRFASFAPDVRDACARSAGRLATAAALGAAYVGALLAARGGARLSSDISWDCVLCQLLGTSCAQEETVFWSASYAAFLAVLLPVAALQAALLVAAAGMCKEPRVVARRLATANCAVLLAMQVQAALERNAPQLPARCAGASAGASAGTAGTARRVVSVEPSWQVISTFFVLYVLDFTADFCAGLVLQAHNAQPGAQQAPRGRASISWPVCFSACRAASVCVLWCLKPLWSDVWLPPAVLLAHTAVALVLAGLDLADVWLQHFANARARRRERLEALQLPLDLHAYPERDQRVDVADVAGKARPSHGPVAATDLRFQPGRNLRAAFEVEPARRRRFMLTFNNKARWPAQTAEKKMM